VHYQLFNGEFKMATPIAPTRGIENNVNNTMTFIPNPLYTIDEHEFSLDTGGVFNDCTSSLISIPDTFHNLDDIQIRVKAIGGDTASATLNNIYGYMPEEREKPALAIGLDILNLMGQSQASGTTNGTSIPEADGLSWENELALDWATQANQNDKSSFTPAFMITNKSISGNTTISVATAVGGTPLQDIPELGGSNWANTGDLRYASIKELLPCIHYFRQNLGYKIKSVVGFFAGGETDVGQYTAGNTSTVAGYKTQLISLADYCYESAGVEIVSIASLGYTVTGTNNVDFDLFRTDAQYEAVAESSRLELGFDGSRFFVEQGRMEDDVHWQQQGLNEWGQRAAEVRNGITTPLPAIDVPTTEFLPTANITVINQFDADESNAAIANEALLTGEQPTLEGGAVLSNSATPFDWGKGLVIDGLGGHLKYATSPDKTDSKTYFYRLKIDNYFAKINNALCGDMYGFSGPSGTRHAGHCITGFVEFEDIGIWINNKAKSLNIPSELIVGQDWVDFCYTIDFTGTIPTAQGFVNGIGYGEVTLDESSGIPDNWNPPINEFTIGACTSKGGDYGELVNAFDVDDFRESNIVDVQAIADFTSTKDVYNLVNTPITPDAPEITNEDNDNDIFEFLPATGTQVSTNIGVDWFDQESPYHVGKVDIPAGDLQVRVKAEGINPDSAPTPSTIDFTAATQIDRTNIFTYASDLNIPLENVVLNIRLVNPVVQYKDSPMYSENIQADPDENGKITFSLPDTDSMTTDEYYIIDFGRGVRSKTQVNKTTEEVNLLNLPNYQRI
jgi:hypothetical protein